MGEHNYEQPHIDDGILDIEGSCHPKQIVTKHSSRNIITTLCGTYILKVKEGCNSDDDDINTDIPNKAIEVPNDNDYNMNFNPNIQILPLVIFINHESQRFHNHRHLTFFNSYT